MAEVHLFFNPAAAAGRSAMRLGVALAKFRQLGVQVELHRPASADAARSSMASMAGNVERIVVVGGDGMVHQAANALAGSSTVLGVISAGTGNDTVTALGLPDDPERACKVALADATAIDVIRTDDDAVAVTVATAGFSVAVNERADRLKRISGAAKYTVSSLIELPQMRTYPITLTLDGESHDVEPNLISVANTSHFGGGMKVAPDADPCDAMLDVVVIGPAPKAMFAAILPTVFSGRHIANKHVQTFRAAEVRIEGELDLRADGEPFAHAPVTMRAEPRSLLVAGVDLPG